MSSGHLLLFDFDGVIADSLELFHEALDTVWRDICHRALDRRDFLRVFDQGMARGLQEIGMSAGLTRCDVETVIARLLDRLPSVIPRASLMEGAGETLTRLAEQGHQIVIITSNKTAVVEAYLRDHGLGPFLVLGLDEEASKVKKIRGQIERHRGLPCYYIGDTLGDMNDAVEAGASTIGFAAGWHGAERIRRGYPSHVVADWQELAAAVGSEYHRFVHVDGAQIFLRFRRGPGDAAIIFVHGLGDSGAAFHEAFAHDDLRPFTLVAVDLPGFGRSEPRHPCGFKEQASLLRRLRQHPDIIGDKPTLLVGHSLGGDIVSHAADAYTDELVGIVNLEGALVPEDLFYSGKAVQAGADFPTWLDELKERMLRAGTYDAAKARYYSSLVLADSGAFLESAHEIVRSVNNGETSAKLVALPRKYFVAAGRPETPSPAMRFLEDRMLGSWHALDAGHSVMLDQPEKVYRLIAAKLREWTWRHASSAGRTRE